MPTVNQTRSLNDKALPGADRLRYHNLLALAILLTLTVTHIALIVSIDNTNLATTNGLWKTPAVHSWEQATGQPLDSGGYLYLPAYGFLSRLIPDRLVSYGVHGTVVTFRKMAILNALFGALASAAVFLLALRIAGSIPTALVAALAHATSGFVLLNSLESEDVVPAYAFFVLVTWMFFEFVATGRRRYLAGSAFLLALVVLFHWSLMIPSVAGLGFALLLLVARDRSRLRVPLEFGIFFIGTLGLCYGIARYIAPLFTSPFWHLLYPPKAGPSGWLGFGVHKFIYALIGVGNYFSGAENFSNYPRAFGSAWLVGSMAISWIYLALTLAVCAWVLLRRRGRPILRLFAGYAIAVFCIGELEHLYSQPQDPQSQIQPMFVTIAGVILILDRLRGRLPARSFQFAAAGLALAFTLNGMWNAERMYAKRGYDGSSVKEVSELKTLFPPAGTTVVTHGFEGWQTWWYVEVFQGDSDAYAKKNIQLASAFTQHGGISAQAAAGIIRKRIQAVFTTGDRVVAGALWTQSRNDFVGSLTALVDSKRAETFDNALRNAFRTGRAWDTPVGRFVELLPLTGGARGVD